MLLTILGYVLAFLMFAWLAPLLGVLVTPLVMMLARISVPASVRAALMTATTACATGFILIGVAALIGIQLAYLMFLLPLYLLMKNDLVRISHAKRGVSRTALELGDNYDKDLAVRTEFGYMVGDVVGMAIPVFVVSPLPLVY